MKKFLLSIVFAFLFKSQKQKIQQLQKSSEEHFLRDDILAGKYDNK